MLYAVGASDLWGRTSRLWGVAQFHLSFSLKDELDAESLEAFIDEFILHAIENNGLVFGGGFNEELNGFVALEKRGSVTDSHIAKIKIWLDSKPNIINIKFGELVDSWV